MQVTGDGQKLRFGRFELLLGRRELRADGVPVHLGSRAFDILALLVKGRGTLVTKEQIVGAVWPGVVVEESNLQVQVSALRKALAEHRDAITTVPGRGYQFTAAIDQGTDEGERGADSGVSIASPPALTNLPVPTVELIGRDAETAAIADRVAAHRLVTLTGTGGIGKTRLGLAVARRMLPRFADGVWVAELAALSDPGLVSGTVAAALGLELSVGAISPERVAERLAGKQLLLVLDNCEHVIDAVARLAQALLRASPAAHLLATSREPLKVEGESVRRVPPLGLPAEDAGEPADLMQYGAVRLFLSLARPAEPQLSTDARIAAAAAAICRRLDGIPLAIELAAARVATLGVEGLAARLDDQFKLLTGGWRTALPRHRTLRATLDWSYDALPAAERAVLARLSIFAGSFTLEAASAVAASGDIAAAQLIECIANLVAKSLLVADVGSGVAQYRLLETTRAYALEKLAEGGMLMPVARRHAECVRDLLAREQADLEELPAAKWLPWCRGQIGNVRAALDWAFSSSGDLVIGVDLIIAAVPLWMQLSLMEECGARVERALAELGPAASEPTRPNMQLHAAHGLSLMYTKGAVAETGSALASALDIADRLDDDDYRMRALWGLWFNRLNNGGVAESLGLAQRFCAIAETSADPISPPVGDRMLGFSLHFLGDQVSARRHLERMLARPAVVRHRLQITRFQFDPWVTARVTLAEILWVLGFPDQAMRMVDSGVDEAVSLDHALTLRNALAKACPVALFAGDLAAVERFLAMLLDVSKRHALAFWRSEGHCFQGVLLIKQGDVAGGLQVLRVALDDRPQIKFALRFNTFLGELAQALGRTGAVAQGLAAIDAALVHAEHSHEIWCLAELLRIKGDLLLLENQPDAAAAAEGYFLRSLEVARRQQALSWELRTATSLARLRRDQHRHADARDLLGTVYGRFSEGFATADLAAAKDLLDALT